MKNKAILYFIGFMLIELGCKTGANPIDSTPTVPVEITDAELRRVIFDETELGWLANRPLYLTEAGMAGVLAMMAQMGGPENAGEAEKLRIALKTAADRLASEKVGDKVWNQLLSATEHSVLTELYSVIQQAPVQRCIGIQLKSLALLDEDPAEFVNSALRDDTAEKLTQEQQAQINAYIASEAAFLKQMSAQMMYWTALSAAYFLQVSLDAGLEKDPNQVAAASEKLALAKAQIKDEDAFLQKALAQADMQQFESEFADIFQKCDSDAAKAYWAYTTAPEYQKYHTTSWNVFYSVITTMFRAQLVF